MNVFEWINQVFGGGGSDEQDFDIMPVIVAGDVIRLISGDVDGNHAGALVLVYAVGESGYVNDSAEYLHIEGVDAHWMGDSPVGLSVWQSLIEPMGFVPATHMEVAMFNAVHATATEMRRARTSAGRVVPFAIQQLIKGV